MSLPSELNDPQARNRTADYVPTPAFPGLPAGEAPQAPPPGWREPRPRATPPPGSQPPAGTTPKPVEERLADILKDLFNQPITIPQAGSPVVIPTPTTTTSPIPVLLVIAGFGIVGYVFYREYKKGGS